MDVFLRWWPQTPLRQCMAGTVAARLGLYDGIEVHTLTHDSVEPYYIWSKRMAEEIALGEIYCVIDDDQLPIKDDFFAQGEKALTENPDYGMLAGFPLEYGLHGQPYADRKEDVIEAHSIGCPYFVRKGTLTFPDGPLRQYDGILSKVVTDQGLKTGFARKCLYNHLGYGFSQVEHAA